MAWGNSKVSQPEHITLPSDKETEKLVRHCEAVSKQTGIPFLVPGLKPHACIALFISKLAEAII